MRAEPYLSLNGVELAHSHRTLSYLRQGLGGHEFEVCIANPLNVGEGGGYQDEYDDIYGGDAYETANLCCFCAAVDYGNYGTPATDPAPWYDATRPESADFLGMIPTIRLLPIIERSVTQRSQGRADIGRQVAKARIVQVTGTMYAANDAGMAYGDAWLRMMLAGGAGGCGGDTLTLLPMCPPDEVEDPSTYLRDLERVGVVDGPTFGPIENNIPECQMAEVRFQLAAGEPWLRQVSDLGTVTLAANDEVCTEITAPAIADAAAKLTIHTGPFVLDEMEIRAYAGGCPPPGSPIVTLAINAMPANHHLTIDASTEEVTLRNTAGVIVGGLDVVDWADVFRWIKAAAGSTMAIVLDTNGASGVTGATVDIEAVNLEW